MFVKCRQLRGAQLRAARIIGLGDLAPALNTCSLVLVTFAVMPLRVLSLSLGISAMALYNNYRGISLAKAPTMTTVLKLHSQRYPVVTQVESARLT